MCASSKSFKKLVYLLSANRLALLAIKGKEAILRQIEGQPAYARHAVRRTATRCLHHVDLVNQRRTNIIGNGNPALHQDGGLLTASQASNGTSVTAEYVLKVDWSVPVVQLVSSLMPDQRTLNGTLPDPSSMLAVHT